MARSAGRTRPVIKDVAKLAGVSAPTVSRYLNGTVNVTEDKRERIAKAIKELGYEPSIVARALSNREMDSVVVFAANPSAFSTSETNHGVEAAARKRRFLLNIVSLDESDMDSVKARVRMGLSIRPAGVIVYEYDRAGIAALEYIPKDMPMVVVGGSFGDGEYQVINAERDGGRWMTMHLLDLGHRTVFHVGVRKVRPITPAPMGGVTRSRSAASRHLTQSSCPTMIWRSRSRLDAPWAVVVM